MATSRDIFALGGERQPAGGSHPPPPPRRAPADNDEQSWERFDLNNASAPNVAGQFGFQGGCVQVDLQGGANTFSLGRGSPPPGPPANISQHWGEGGDGTAMTPTGPAPGGGYIAPPQQAWLLTTRGPYSGMAAAIDKWGVGDAKTQAQELLWQQGVGGDKAKIEQFRDVAGALQEFKAYIFVKPGGTSCTVVHLPMKFMAITEATQQLQGHFIGFVGNQTLYKEPTPILLPPRKTWE
jgi:hypothetical protein